MKTKLYLSCLTLVLAVAGLAACDKASPVAPEGTVLSVTANPTQISATGTSQIRVVALRANGTPVNPGTQIRLSTSLGTVDPVAVVGENGIAVATLQGDGRIGTATVTAAVGAETTSTVEVQVGQLAASVGLQATPSSIPDSGGTVTLLAVVSDEFGQPLPNATVNFGTDIGTLASGGGFRTTDANGQATDRLTISESEINALPSTQNEFEVRAQAGGAEAAGTFTIRIETAPLEADFVASISGRTVQFSDLSTGEPTQWFWSFGDGSTSRQQNPSHTYSNDGTFTVTLKVTRGREESETSEQVTVTL